MIKNFKGIYYKLPGTHINIITNEGDVAVKDAIDFLKNQKPSPVLESKNGLNRACADHVEDIGQRGIASHEGKDGSRMCNRIDKYGEWEVSIAENITFDDCEAKDIVFNMLIDDGNTTRGHRKNLFNPDFKCVGIASGMHSKYKHVTVINFAVGYTDKV